MNIVKSHLKHINIKLFSQKKKKKKKLNCSLTRNTLKHTEMAETTRNINMYISVVFLVPSGVPE